MSESQPCPHQAVSVYGLDFFTSHLYRQQTPEDGKGQYLEDELHNAESENGPYLLSAYCLDCDKDLNFQDVGAEKVLGLREGCNDSFQDFGTLLSYVLDYLIPSSSWAEEQVTKVFIELLEARTEADLDAFEKTLLDALEAVRYQKAVKAE